MIVTLAPPRTLLADLFDYCEAEFGRHAAGAALVMLAVLTGRTGRPIAAGTCGPGCIHSRLVPVR